MLSSVSGERFVALDVHKHYVVVGAVNPSQQVVLSPRRVDLDDFLSWSQTASLLDGRGCVGSYHQCLASL